MVSPDDCQHQVSANQAIQHGCENTLLCGATAQQCCSSAWPGNSSRAAQPSPAGEVCSSVVCSALVSALSPGAQLPHSAPEISTPSAPLSLVQERSSRSLRSRSSVPPPYPQTPGDKNVPEKTTASPPLTEPWGTARSARAVGSPPLLLYHTTQSSPAVGMSNIPTGKLWWQRYKGEYAMLKDAPMSESDSVQVSKREVTGVHNGVQMVTVGNVHTSPYPVLPDAMPLATQRRGHKPTQILELRRLLPLTFVKVSIHTLKKQQLHLKLATGHSFYLQLCPRSHIRDLFAHWKYLVYMLKPAAEVYSSTHAIVADEALDIL
ncbi:LOW QUALITY PROTEIN: Golgi-associated RAB2 interactor protein 6 [Desmodus rotundus]|uniref:LOW QUALITY PROTEIN: Golgi-associated RAB2 interactor protein 6 n=1 Tax=Desmodus rotundus TaxID=9430 RepID=UPI002380D722|nr:LOW QUALITY PROTEIN: Golgi-associated RAB2 interactor protein 6 [Desmodus rotundus]